MRRSCREKKTQKQNDFYGGETNRYFLHSILKHQVTGRKQDYYNDDNNDSDLCKRIYSMLGIEINPINTNAVNSFK